MEYSVFGDNLRFLREREGWTKSEMPDRIGFERTTWSGYENGSSTPNLKNLIKIAKFFGVNEGDLLHRKLDSGVEKSVKEPVAGADLNPALTVNEPASPYSGSRSATPNESPALRIQEKNSPRQAPAPGTKRAYELPSKDVQYNLGMPRIITVNEREEENIIYVPVKARAGYLTGYGDAEYIQSLPSYRMPGLTNGTYRMFEVEGPSMAPNIISGDKVIGQWVPDLDEIRENRVHIVVTKDGVVIKRVLNRIDQRGKLVLKSDTINHRKEYPTYEINPDDVLEIWYARVKLSSDFSEPIEVYHRLADLEADVTAIKSVLQQFKTIG